MFSQNWCITVHKVVIDAPLVCTCTVVRLVCICGIVLMTWVLVLGNGHQVFCVAEIENADFGSELIGFKFEEELRKATVGLTPAVEENTSPKATGYLISTSPPGDLPTEFWGHDRPQSFCSMFKVLLHCHRSTKEFLDSPQETLG